MPLWVPEVGGPIRVRSAMAAITPPAGPPASVGEQAYRIVLAPALPGLPRYSLPLFRSPAAPALHARLQARVEALGPQAMLRLSNSSTLHGRLHDLRFIAADGQSSLLVAGLAGYGGMVACAAGEIAAAWITGGDRSPVAAAFEPERFSSQAHLAILKKDSSATGAL